MIDKFRHASPAGQIAVAFSALGVISLALTLLWFFAFRVDYRPIFTHLDTADAAAMMAELDKRKIAYRLADGGTSIAVPGEQADAVRVSLLGSAAGRRGTTGFELFDKSDMGITDFAQKINFQRALQGELERTIETLDGVKTARVHLSLGDDRLFREDRAVPKASALIEMRDGQSLSDLTVEGVRRLVAASVPSLDPSDVVVLDARGHVLADEIGAQPAQADLSPAAARRKAIADLTAADIRRALEPVFGANYVDVTVAIPVTEHSSLDDPGVPALDAARRDYPLRVTLTLKAQSADKVLDSARGLVGKTIGLRADLGDSIMIEGPSNTPANVPTPVAAVPHHDTKPAMPQPAAMTMDQGVIGALPVVMAGLLLLIAMVLVAGRLRRTSPGPVQHQQFAAHLQTLLDAEETR